MKIEMVFSLFLWMAAQSCDLFTPWFTRCATIKQGVSLSLSMFLSAKFYEYALRLHGSIAK